MPSNHNAPLPPDPIRLVFPSRRLRRWLLAGLAALLLLGVAQGLFWAWLAGRMEFELAGWVAERRGLGWQVTHGPPRRGGWPWAVRLSLPAVRIVEPGGLGWQAESLALDLALPWPRALALAATGPQALLAGAARLPFQAASLTGSVPLAGLPVRLAAEAIVTEAGSPPLLRRATLVLPQEGSFDLALEGLALPAEAPAAARALGPQLERLAMQGALNTPLPAAASPARQAAAWRDAGGRLQLHALDLLWGPVRAAVQGELALDSALQPVGQLTLTLAGLREALDALAAAGVIEPGNAHMLGLLGAMLPRSPLEGGATGLRLPLVLRDRTLAAVGFTLLRLPPVVWPAE